MDDTQDLSAVADDLKHLAHRLERARQANTSPTSEDIEILVSLAGHVESWAACIED